MLRFVVLSVVLVGLILGSCNESSVSTPSCPEGSESCPCYGNGSCDAGLECRSDLCVAPTSAQDGDATDDDDDLVPGDGDADDDDDDTTDGDTTDDDDDSTDGDAPTDGDADDDDDDDDSTDGDAPTDGDAEDDEADGDGEETEEAEKNTCDTSDECAVNEYCHRTQHCCATKKQHFSYCLDDQECYDGTCIYDSPTRTRFCVSSCRASDCPAEYLSCDLPSHDCYFYQEMTGDPLSPCRVDEDCHRDGNTDYTCWQSSSYSPTKTCSPACISRDSCGSERVCAFREGLDYGLAFGSRRSEDCPCGTVYVQCDNETEEHCPCVPRPGDVSCNGYCKRYFNATSGAARSIRQHTDQSMLIRVLGERIFDSFLLRNNFLYHDGVTFTVSRRFIMSRFVALSVVLVGLILGSCNESSVSTPSCPEGSETCPCYDNGSCDAGLECQSDLCVAPTSAQTAMSPMTTTTLSQRR